MPGSDDDVSFTGSAVCVSGSEINPSTPSAKPGTPSRRSFLQGAGCGALGMMAASELAKASALTTGAATTNAGGPVKIPAHLPAHLTIVLWIWGYLTACGPGEPYEDLDRAFAETVERGYNTIRAEMALNWCFDANGKPRGEIAIASWAPGV